MARARKRGARSASGRGAALKVVPINSPGDSSTAVASSSLSSLPSKLNDCRLEFRSMEATVRKSGTRKSVRQMQSPAKCLKSQITDFFTPKRSVRSSGKTGAGFDQEPPVLKRFDEDDDEDTGPIDEPSAEDKEMPWIIPQPKEEDQASDRSECDSGKENEVHDLAIADARDASRAGSPNSMDHTPERSTSSKRCDARQTQRQGPEQNNGKKSMNASSKPQFESTRVITRSRAALVHKQMPHLSINTSPYVTPPSSPSTQHRAPSAAASSPGKSPAPSLSPILRTATPSSPPMLHKIRLVECSSESAASSPSKAANNLKISAKTGTTTIPAPSSPNDASKAALDDRSRTHADATSQKQHNSSANGAVGQHMKKTSTTLKIASSLCTKGPKKRNGRISSVPKTPSHRPSLHQPSNKLLAAATSSHKVTDFFPIRRSERKPKKALEEEQLKDVETHLAENDDSSLDIHVEHFPEKGRGVVAERDFHKGEFVVEYAGDLIDIGKAKEREETYSLDLSTGCYMYYFKHKGKQYCIDATSESGRLGRLVNHSRTNPNLQPKVVELFEKPRLILVARKDITKDEELLYDYGDRSKESLNAHPWLAL